MSKAIIEVNGLASGYVKGLNILQGVDLVLKEKEIVSIIGPNGAGKSTLLKAIMGIIPVFGGKIFLNGQELKEIKSYELVNQGIAYVPQVLNVFPSLTVQENLEMGIWGKATNYEIATRVPLIFWTPEMKDRGKPANGLVELVDLYPTLCDLAGLSKPKHLSGTSLAPLLQKPNLKGKEFAVSQFPNPALREWAANPLSPGMRETFFGPLIEQVENKIKKQQGGLWDRNLFENHLMGYTIRTERYRLVVWLDYRDTEKEPVFLELFNHLNDPNETKNIAGEFPAIAQRLLKKLRSSEIGERGRRE